MNRDEAPAAACVDGHARSLEVVRVRNTIGHDGIAGTRSSVLRLPVHVAKTDLLIVWWKLADDEAIKNGIYTFDEGADIDSGRATFEVLDPETS